MNWGAHLVLGAACGVIAAYLLSLPIVDAFIFTSVSGIAALLPDLDLRKSKASQIVGGAAAALALILALLWSNGDGVRFLAAFCAMLLALLALDWFLRPRHRTIFHSAIAALVLAAACLFLFGWIIALACAMGYLSHLAADRMG